MATILFVAGAVIVGDPASDGSPGDPASDGSPGDPASGCSPGDTRPHDCPPEYI